MSRFEIKIVAALLLIAVIPLAASVYLVGQVIKASDRVAEGQSRRLAQPLERAAHAYRGLFAARKRTFQLQGQLMAMDPSLTTALDPLDAAALKKRLGQIVNEQPGVGLVEVVDRHGAPIAQRKREGAFAVEAYRDLRLTFPLSPATAKEGGLSLRVVFYTPRAPFEDFRRLDQAQRTSAEITKLRDELAAYYRVAFLIMFGAVALVATGLGLFIARRTARRVAVLAQATHKVAEGDLETRVQLRSRDEIGDLARSFNEMMQQIQESRERISYLEKIGAWQEIARRLAHEIKNPLTPIQLAVQQIYSKYQGEDPEFTRLLDDARDIITEEVDGLRRLVQAFSAFAKLPSVQPEPVELNALVDDFLKSHSDLAQQVRIDWTPVEPSCKVLVDRLLIKHVLLNLVENAMQAAEEADTLEQLQISLEVRVDPASRRAELSVEDNGPGMDLDTARQVFNPYFTTKERGTGLGLAIVKKIVLEHRGSISFDTKLGGGTRFLLTVPLARE